MTDNETSTSQVPMTDNETSTPQAPMTDNETSTSQVPMTDNETSTPQVPGGPVEESKTTVRRKSLGQRMISGLTQAKRVALKALGEIHLPEEDEKFQEKLGAFQLDTDVLIELTTRIVAFHTAQKESVQNQSAFAESLAKLGSHSKSSSSCVTVQEFVPFNLRLSSKQNQFNQDVYETLIVPLQSLLTNEMVAVRELMKKYEVVRLELGDRNRSFKQKGTDVNQARVTESGATLDKIKQELAERISIVTAKKDFLLQNNLVEYVQQQHTYYDESLKQVNEFEASFSLPKGDEDDE